MTSENCPSRLTSPTFWKITPTINIPIRAGRVVRLISHPPKCAAIAKVASPNNCPPGAAISPTMEYTTPQDNNPMRVKAMIRENWRYVGQKGYGHSFGQIGGCQEGCCSLDRHFTQKVYHQDLEYIIITEVYLAFTNIL